MVNGIKAELDGFPVKELFNRYDIGRTVLYERINALKIDIEKRGSRGYISAEQLALLDDLDSHIKDGGTTPEFLRWNPPQGKQQSKQQSEQQTETTRIARFQDNEQSSEQLQLLPCATIFSPTIQLLPPAPNPILEAETRRRVLREASVHGDVLTTTELLALLELRQLPRGCGEQFERRGFVFQRVRKGREGEWRVKRG